MCPSCCYVYTLKYSYFVERQCYKENDLLLSYI